MRVLLDEQLPRQLVPYLVGHDVRTVQQPVTSKQVAERVWEPKFLGEIMAGRDPGVAPNKPDTTGVLTVAEFLDRYQTNYVEAEGLKSVATVLGTLKALKASLGDLPVTALEKPADISRFKAEYRPGRKIATVNRGTRRPPRGDQLGQIPGSAAALDDPVPSFRRNHQSTRGNETGSAHPPRRGTEVPGRVRDDELGRAQVRGTRDARSHHRGARDVLPAGGDAAHPEPARGLAAASDIKTTQRYLNITDEELRKVLTGVWERRRQLIAVGQ